MIFPALAFVQAKMDLWQLAGQLPQKLSNALTRGPAAIPLWAAFVWCLFLLYRKQGIKFLCLLTGLNDPYLIQSVVKKTDAAIQILLASLAVLPFFGLLNGTAGKELLRLGVLVPVFLLVHILIQASNLIFSSWYLSKRQVEVPAAFRVVVLSVLYFALGLLLLDLALGVNMLPVLATSTVLTAVLGLSLQDTLRNIFAGLTLTLEKSFKPGDWVNMQVDPNHTAIAQVVEIGWRSTKLRTRDNNVKIIPNASLIQNEVINYDSPTSTQGFVIEVPVSCKVEPKSVCEALENAAGSVAGVLKEPPAASWAREIRVDQIVYRLRFWLDGIQKQEETTSKVIQACWQQLETLQPDSEPEKK
jgi:small-conductance mechanosensitive channel